MKTRLVKIFITALLALAFFVVLRSGSGPLSRKETRAESLFRQALDLRERGEWRRSLTLFERAASFGSPKDVAALALYEKAMTLLTFSDETDETALSFEVAADFAPDSVWGMRARKTLAELCEDVLMDYEEAVVQWSRLLQVITADPEAAQRAPMTADQVVMRIALCYFRLGNYQQARVELSPLLQKSADIGTRRRAAYMIARSFYIGGEPKECIKTIQENRELFRGSALEKEALYTLACCYEDADKSDEAEKILRYLKERDELPVFVDMRLKAIRERRKLSGGRIAEQR